MPKSVAVVGGGITGITAALHAARAGHAVHLFEAQGRLGGKIGEVEVDGTMLPTGPDAFLARRPEMIDLATSLGLTSKLTTPAAGSARIYRDGRLYPLPPNVLGIPATDDLSQTHISPAGADRARLDLTATDDRPDGDESVGDLVRRRLGDEVLEYLVDPLLGGINAGDTDRLSVLDGVPQIAVLRDKDPSLLTAAKATLSAAPANPGPVFHSIEGGLNRLIEAAQAGLAERSVTLHLGTPATIAPDGTSWSVGGDETFQFDDVIITTPAHVTANLLDGFAARVAQDLRAIDYSSVALIVLKLAPRSIDIDKATSGVLVPRLCGLSVTAVSFANHKWPQLSNDGSQILRVSVGRRTDTRFIDLDDAELLAAVQADLETIFGTPAEPQHAVVTRWMRSLPQYDVGHRVRVLAIDEGLAELTGLHVTGAWRNGLGLPASSGSGRIAATKLPSTP